VPKVSEFFGIVIYVYWRDHGPPHFHAVYGGDEALIAIRDLSVLRGRLPPRAMGLVVEWDTPTGRTRERLAAGTESGTAQPNRAAGIGEPRSCTKSLL
jgi:hypothetical protein